MPNSELDFFLLLVFQLTTCGIKRLEGDECLGLLCRKKHYGKKFIIDSCDTGKRVSY